MVNAFDGLLLFDQSIWPLEINLVTEKEKDLIQRLNGLFEIEFNLYFVTHSAHWNTVGVTFYEIHLLLEKQYTQIWESLDDIAEKIRQLDAVAPYDLRKIAASEDILDCHAMSVQQMAETLMRNHEVTIAWIKGAIRLAKEAGREDLVNYLGGLWEQHGKMRWMLRATAQQ